MPELILSRARRLATPQKAGTVREREREKERGRRGWRQGERGGQGTSGCVWSTREGPRRGRWRRSRASKGKGEVATPERGRKALPRGGGGHDVREGWARPWARWGGKARGEGAAAPGVTSSRVIAQLWPGPARCGAGERASVASESAADGGGKRGGRRRSGAGARSRRWQQRGLVPATDAHLHPASARSRVTGRERQGRGTRSAVRGAQSRRLPGLTVARPEEHTLAATWQPWSGIAVWQARTSSQSVARLCGWRLSPVGEDGGRRCPARLGPLRRLWRERRRRARTL